MLVIFAQRLQLVSTLLQSVIGHSHCLFYILIANNDMQNFVYIALS